MRVLMSPDVWWQEQGEVDDMDVEFDGDTHVDSRKDAGAIVRGLQVLVYEDLGFVETVCNLVHL